MQTEIKMKFNYSFKGFIDFVLLVLMNDVDIAPKL